jgi:hypothetical protein
MIASCASKRRSRVGPLACAVARAWNVSAPRSTVTAGFATRLWYQCGCAGAPTFAAMKTMTSAIGVDPSRIRLERGDHLDLTSAPVPFHARSRRRKTGIVGDVAEACQGSHDVSDRAFRRLGPITRQVQGDPLDHDVSRAAHV